MSRVVFRAAAGAVDDVVRIAKPGLRPAARAIVSAIPGHVPVQSGTVRGTYHPQAAEQDDAIRVHVGSPFWHWLEYGTRFNPAYRPVENAVRGLGLRYESL